MSDLGSTDAATRDTEPSDVARDVMARLAERGHRAWRVGATARATLCEGPEPPLVELLTDADDRVCDRLTREILAESAGRYLSLSALDKPTLVETLLARGITVEAIAVDAAGEVIDPAGGLEHLAAGQIRTISPPDRAFREDPLMLLRVPRVIAWTGLGFSTDLRRYAHRDAGNLLDVRHPAGGWGVEMNALLLGPHIERALAHLHDTRVLGFALPEIAAMIGFHESCAVHHKDIWEHTKIVTQKAAPNLVVRWAALCHDIGKIWTRQVMKNGKVHFFRHESHGAVLFESIGFRFGLDPDLCRRVSYVVENHSRVNLYQGEWTDSAVRRLIKEAGEHLADLVTFSKADYTTKREARIREMQRTLGELETRIEAIRRDDARLPPLPTGFGEAIMARFELPPSRAVGQLKQLLEEACAAGVLQERQPAAVYLEWLAANPEALKIVAAGPAGVTAG